MEPKRHTNSAPTLDQLTALCKRRGFIFQSAEIYGGLNGLYDRGPLGVLLQDRIRSLWTIFNNRVAHSISSKIVPIDGALIGPQALWKASGHEDNFHDTMVDCLNCKRRFRIDDVSLQKACSHCGKCAWTEPKVFNLMFATKVGAAEHEAQIGYLRPETAQTVFANFKNVYSTMRVKIPFGISQMGKAFRNEITPKQFLFRMREFEQMELEWFCHPSQGEFFFTLWSQQRLAFYSTILGMNKERFRLRPYTKEELSHYSSATNDIEYEYAFGWKEIEGIANRTDFDLKNHALHSKKDLSIHEEGGESFIPHVVESSVGIDRLMLTLLHDAYEEQQLEGGDIRTVLHFSPNVAPVFAMVCPLMKSLSEPALVLWNSLSSQLGVYTCWYDETGSIGKRYRRADEIGVPFCITLDFETEKDGMVTVRHRDSMEQNRVAINELSAYLLSFVTSNR